MNCPACDKILIEITVGDIKLDVCENGCGGIWFDRFELQKVDESHESLGEHLLEIKRDEDIRVDHNKRRKCPKCKNIVMLRHFFSVKREVEVDECVGCGGYWIDYGELKTIKTQFATEEERKKAADAYFSDIFELELGTIKEQSQEKKEKARKIAKAFRFICPSNYIRGKQDWGAF